MLDLVETKQLLLSPVQVAVWLVLVFVLVWLVTVQSSCWPFFLHLPLIVLGDFKNSDQLSSLVKYLKDHCVEIIVMILCYQKTGYIIVKLVVIGA